jgi:hypothetical protein
VPPEEKGASTEKGPDDDMELLIFLLVVFLIALVAGFGWRAGTRRRL